MNEELTNEVMEAIKKCENYCPTCSANEVCSKHTLKEMRQALATALLEERAKPKVWDGAPEWAKIGRVYWTSGYDKEAYSKLYNRELPKSRARQIAEELTGKIANRDATYEKSVFYFDGEPLVDVIEAVLNKYAEELEGKE